MGTSTSPTRDYNSRRSLICEMFKALWRLKVKDRPLILSHEINSKCNLRCKFCPCWEGEGGEMSKEEIFGLLKEAKSLGVVLYNAWTVEPLLREDLPEILEHAHRLGMMTSLITNGVLLKNRIGELSDLDYLSVSMDGIESFEELRGFKLDVVLDGIKQATDRGIPTAINCVINGKNLDEIEGLIYLAMEMGAWISFEPIYEYRGISQEVWKEMGIRDMDRYEKVIDRIIELKKEGAPIINSQSYLKVIKNPSPKFKCHANKVILHISSDGKIENCRACRDVLGKIEDGLKNVWKSSKDEREGVSKGCGGCLFFGYVESSLLYSLKPEVMLNCGRYVL